MTKTGGAPYGRMLSAIGLVAVLAGGCATADPQAADQGSGAAQLAQSSDDARAAGSDADALSVRALPADTQPGAVQTAQSSDDVEATEDDPDDDGWFGPDNDPLEFVNRFTFAFNDMLDTMLIKPAAVTYDFLVPDPVQDSIRNALRNLNGPVIFANDLMQGRLERAETTGMRFLINSTIGVAGLFDVAADWGYEYHREDFGQTLGTWGVGEGFYLVLPIVGPSTLRDAVGMGVDSLIDPWSYVLHDGFGVSDETTSWIMLGRRGLEGIDYRAQNIQTLDSIRADAIDYYARLRTLYRQNRDSQIRDNEEEEIPIPGLSEVDWLKDGAPTPGPSSAELDQTNLKGE